MALSDGRSRRYALRLLMNSTRKSGRRCEIVIKAETLYSGQFCTPYRQLAACAGWTLTREVISMNIEIMAHRNRLVSSAVRVIVVKADGFTPERRDAAASRGDVI